MAADRIPELAVAHVQNAVKQGDEHGRTVLTGQRGIQILQAFTGTTLLQRSGAQQRAADRHEQGSRDPFAADVADHQAKMIAVEEEVIEQIAANLLGRHHGSVQVEVLAVRKWRKLPRQDRLLDTRGDAQFVLDGHQLLLRAQRVLQLLHLRQRLLNGDFQILEIDGLHQKVDSAPVHSRADIGHVAVGGDDHGFARIARLIELSQQSQAVHHRHVDIAQNQIDAGLYGKRLQRFLAVVAEEEFQFAVADLAAESLANEQL
jgi:hypothetical protein